MSDGRLYSEACERNKEPIEAVLRELLGGAREGLEVLEVASGTGQHAVHMARALPHVRWQPTEVPGGLDSISAWREAEGLANVAEPVALDVSAPVWPVEGADVVFSANMIHYVDWSLVVHFFRGVGQVLRRGGLLVVYGPYRYADRPLEPSNERFDGWLKAREPGAGVRLFDDVDALARAEGLRLEGDRAMPANNRTIWWRREGGAGATSG